MRAAQRGFTLIEIMIALGIAFFLLFALLTVVQTNKTAFANQSQLAQLQDSQRMAMTLMADVIQTAGYFPDPTTNTAGSTLIPSGAFASAQTITGLYSAAAPGDAISVRYMTKGGDGILNCSGNSNPVGGANTLYVNQFTVVPGTSGGQLVCTMNGTAYTLVNGVSNLSVLYGVKTNLATAGNNVDTYLNASQMTAANWSNVITVVISLTFDNPLYKAAGQGQAQFITIQRVVDLMNQSGPVT
ncbi:MAG TPA: PilW family protein [Steroidobacteraceae bacterium]|nr:PilW family protein [Steroidobacteraceae bacterium]